MEKLGLSGDNLIIEGSYIVKVCETNQQRFLKNITKQRQFQSQYITSVPIIEQGRTADGKNFIKMPFLRSSNPIFWLSKATTDCYYQLESKLLSYLEEIRLNSQIDNFAYSIWTNKIDDLLLKIPDHSLREILLSLRNNQFTQPFYYGNNHGDLTFSNLLIYNEGSQISIDTIDFLDSFIQSPINDLVKIRQDTKHLWTLHLMKNFQHIDTGRVMTFLAHMDSKLINVINNDPIWKEYYIAFQILNLMRIIPYNKEPKIFDYLKEEIEGLFHEFNACNALRRQIHQV